MLHFTGSRGLHRNFELEIRLRLKPGYPNKPVFVVDRTQPVWTLARVIPREPVNAQKINSESGSKPRKKPDPESTKRFGLAKTLTSSNKSTFSTGNLHIISALYVIDLQKFRQIAVGDRLRGQYQGLSGDPNSLANLDQDLPNNMIHQDKIKSIPQEWLWCETWCDDCGKKNGKTIDFCNNPLTKEPKLDSATRIIGEWKSYDDEIREVTSGGKGAENGIDTEDSHTEL